VSAESEGLQSEITSDHSARISLSTKFYSREAILRAASWLSNAAFIQVPDSSDSKFVVLIRQKHTTPTLEVPKQVNIDELVGEFCNSVLEFELRQQVQAETTQIRQIILAKAFSESGVLEDLPPGSALDPVEQAKPSGFVKIINGEPR